MSKYLLFLAFVSAASTAGACGLDGGNCQRMQSGDEYVVQQRPVEKIITDCDPGVDCRHMQSGHHYSQQKPVKVDFSN